MASHKNRSPLLKNKEAAFAMDVIIIPEVLSSLVLLAHLPKILYR